MIGRLNHVAIAVPDLAKATARYRDMLGATVTEPEDLPEHGVTVVFIRLPNTNVELLHPYGENSPIAPFLAKNPSGGMHHVCYEVEDIEKAVEFLLATDTMRVLNPKPKIGAHGKPVVFLHPKDNDGVLTELEQA
ncbi:MAG: methylmalonyl-CoA epimerase [Magnetococcales bacterium]|nr:methylmalonyl-CoA epimerase [Magnetococcales bacterium]